MVTDCRICPWRYGNRFDLLVDGGCLFDRMLAASRGVRVAALFDDLGSRELRAEDRRRLAEGGVELRFFNAPAWGKRLASLLRNHRKLLLVDDRLQQPGSVGFRWNLALDRRNWTRRLEDRPNSQVFPDPQTVGAAPCVS